MNSYRPDDMVRAIAAGAVTIDQIDTVYVDGTYSQYAGVLQLMADVTGVDAIVNIEDMAVHGAARMAVAMVHVTELSDHLSTTVCRLMSTAKQRDAWTRRWLESVHKRFECIRDARPDFMLKWPARPHQSRTSWTLVRDVARFVRSKFPLLLKTATDDIRQSLPFVSKRP